MRRPAGCLLSNVGTTHNTTCSTLFESSDRVFGKMRSNERQSKGGKENKKEVAGKEREKKS